MKSPTEIINDILDENALLKGRIEYLERARKSDLHAIEVSEKRFEELEVENKRIKEMEVTFRKANDELADKCKSLLQSQTLYEEENKKLKRGVYSVQWDKKDAYIMKQQQQIIDLQNELETIREFVIPLKELLNKFGLNG